MRYLRSYKVPAHEYRVPTNMELDRYYIPHFTWIAQRRTRYCSELDYENIAISAIQDALVQFDSRGWHFDTLLYHTLRSRIKAEYKLFHNEVTRRSVSFDLLVREDENTEELDAYIIAPQNLDDIELRVAVQEALNQVPLSERTILQLKFWAQYTDEETAGIFEVSRAVIRKRFQSAFSHMRDAIGSSLI